MAKKKGEERAPQRPVPGFAKYRRRPEVVAARRLEVDEKVVVMPGQEVEAKAGQYVVRGLDGVQWLMSEEDFVRDFDPQLHSEDQGRAAPGDTPPPQTEANTRIFNEFPPGHHEEDG